LINELFLIIWLLTSYSFDFSFLYFLHILLEMFGWYWVSILQKKPMVLWYSDMFATLNNVALLNFNSATVALTSFWLALRKRKLLVYTSNSMAESLNSSNLMALFSSILFRKCNTSSIIILSDLILQIFMYNFIFILSSGN
jgi:hypothetical protein